ncbi:MAG: hypothetical protein EF812_06345 [Methanosarcinales archaeon]|nr:MAG: hypothetical protein EF812_06345 [Methanosarcinales archaeon]
MAETDIKFPGRIFAIGGAGKELVYTMLETEWVLREILRPKFSRSMINITIVDTAIDEENYDRTKIEQIKKMIGKIEEEYSSEISSTDKELGRIDIEYKLITKEMVLQSPFDLVGIGDDIKQSTGASVWWINDDQLGEDWLAKVMSYENFSELNFSKGVYRKRAVGKAIYYKALAGRLFDIDLLTSTKIAIIVGLGGGTGSGMAFDLAKKLKNIQPTSNITLFGVLSTLRESIDEKANSFAMLSELEYASLNRDTPFKDIVLVPMEVTQYPGKQRASHEHEILLRQFDETFSYTLISHYNNPAQSLFEDLPNFAPFVIASPQLVRYNVESIKHIKDEIIETFNDKKTSLATEGRLYATIEKFIEKHTNEESSGERRTLQDEDRSFIEDRFSSFKMVLEHDFFKELEYNSVKNLKKAVDDGIRGSVSDDIEQWISSIKSEVDTMSLTEGFRDDIDSDLYKIMVNDIEMIERMKNVLGRINNVHNSIIKDTLKNIVKADESSLGRKLNQVRKETDLLSDQNKRLNNDVKSLENQIKEYEEKIKRQVTGENQKWYEDVKDNIEYLNSIDELGEILKNNLKNLDSELSEFVNRINSHHRISSVDTESTHNIEDILHIIEQKLNTARLTYEDARLIKRSLNDLKELKKAYIKSGLKIPIIDKMLGAVLPTGRLKEKREAENRYTRKKVELNNSHVFDVSGNRINVIYDYNIDHKVHEKTDNMTKRIVGEVKEIYPGAESNILLELDGCLHDPARRRKTNIEQVILSHLGFEEKIGEKKRELIEKASDLDEIKEKMEVYKELENKLTSLTADLKGHSRHLRKYHSTIANISRTMKAISSAKGDSDEIRYLIEMQPTDIFKATAVDADINKILEVESEVRTLKRSLQDGIGRTIDNRYNMLVRRVFETKDSAKRWEKSKAMLSFVSIADVSPELVKSRQMIREAFSLGDENYSDWRCPWGDLWGVGIVLFVAGIFADNIRSVIDPKSGYYESYKSIEQNPDKIVFFHHSYMLENGKFVKRNKIFNLEREEDKIQFLQNEKDIDKMLINNYEEMELKKCL